MVIRLETAQWGGSSGGRAAESGRIKLSFELTGVNFSGTHTVAHTATGAASILATWGALEGYGAPVERAPTCVGAKSRLMTRP